MSEHPSMKQPVKQPVKQRVFLLCLALRIVIAVITSFFYPLSSPKTTCFYYQAVFRFQESRLEVE